MENVEVEYETEVNSGKLRTIIYVDALREPIRHSSSLRQAQKHPDGAEGYVEEKVKTLVARAMRDKREKEDGLEEEVPNNGKMEVNPDEHGQKTRPPSERKENEG